MSLALICHGRDRFRIDTGSSSHNVVVVNPVNFNFRIWLGGEVFRNVSGR